MKQFKVFYEVTEIRYSIIKAETMDEAEEYADTNYSDYDWDYVDGATEGRILFGESEEL